jgi:hypothetical protein
LSCSINISKSPLKTGTADWHTNPRIKILISFFAHNIDDNHETLCPILPSVLSCLPPADSAIPSQVPQYILLPQNDAIFLLSKPDRENRIRVLIVCPFARIKRQPLNPGFSFDGAGRISNTGSLTKF